MGCAAASPAETERVKVVHFKHSVAVIGSNEQNTEGDAAPTQSEAPPSYEAPRKAPPHERTPTFIHVQ